MAEVDLTMMLQSRILIIFNLPRLDPRVHHMTSPSPCSQLCHNAMPMQHILRLSASSLDGNISLSLLLSHLAMLNVAHYDIIRTCANKMRIAKSLQIAFMQFI